MARNRWILLLLLGAAVVLALTYAFLPKPVPVEAAAVSRGPLRVTVEEEGKTRVVDRYVVSAPVAGFARRIELDAGDPVARGQVVAELEPLRSSFLDPRSRAESEARVKSAQAALAAANENARAAAATSGLAGTTLGRTRRLFEAGLATREALDRAETEARQSRAALRAAESAASVARFELEAARAVLRYPPERTGAPYGHKIPVRSPAGGTVLNVIHRSEGVVSPGQPLVEIGDPRTLEVQVDVLSSEAVEIRPGMRVLFTRWGGDFPLEGRVRVVEPGGFTKVSALGVEEQRVLVIADIALPPEAKGRLGDGYRVEAGFIVWEGAGVLQVPASALFRRGEDWAVFVFEGGKARTRPVKVGRRGGLAAQVLAGLAEGEKVVVHPPDTVAEGTRVRVRVR
jgi:HlyD family secretion protein